MEDLGRTRCPHCGDPLRKFLNPQLSSWDSEYQLVCFNDNCPYFVRGWRWMLEKFNVTASYRYRLDPATGESGPLPVWSKLALRTNIVEHPNEPEFAGNPTVESEVGGPSHGRSGVVDTGNSERGPSGS